MSFFRMAMMAIAMEIKSFHDGVPENRIRERFALTLGILKRGAGIESGAGAQSAEKEMKMSKMKKNRKKLFAILLQAALVSTAMTMPAYALKRRGSAQMR